METHKFGEDLLSYMCSLAMEKCSKKEERRRASCGGDAMRKRLLIKNFVSHILERQPISVDEKDLDPSFYEEDAMCNADSFETDDDYSESDYLKDVSMCPPSTSMILEQWAHLDEFEDGVSCENNALDDENNVVCDGDGNDINFSHRFICCEDYNGDPSESIPYGNDETTTFAGLKNINLFAMGGCRAAESGSWCEGMSSFSKNNGTYVLLESAQHKRTVQDDPSLFSSLLVPSKRIKYAF